MKRFTYLSMSVVAFASLVVLAGCGEDPKERIALLEQENQQLLDDMAGLRAEADDAARGRSTCEDELARLRADNARLMSQVSTLRSQPRPEPKPTVPEGWTAVPGGAMIALQAEVLFPSGKAELRPEAKRALDGIISVIRSKYGDHDVLVYGHTDNDPIKKSGWDDNLELSAQRALSVVRYLRDQGMAPSKLVAAGCGEYRPAAPNTSVAAKAKNRRVEIYALEADVRRAGG